MTDEAALAEAFTVIGHHDHEGGILEALDLELIQELSHVMIGVGNLRVIVAEALRHLLIHRLGTIVPLGIRL